MDLAGWHGRLQRHFEDLRRSRSAALGDKPIFGLEHGLDAGDIESLQNDVRAHMAAGPQSIDEPLPWVAYASELGYQYAGDEYWQTFEDRRPITYRARRAYVQALAARVHLDELHPGVRRYNPRSSSRCSTCS